MKRLLACFIICLTVSAFGQANWFRAASAQHTVSAAAPSYPLSPTNNPGYNPYTWWFVSNGITLFTNSGVMTLADYTTNRIDLTNAGVAYYWPSVEAARLNNQDALASNGSNPQGMQNLGYTNWQPAEYILLVSWTNAEAYGNLFSGSTDTHRQGAYKDNSTRLAMITDSTSGDPCGSVTNKYCIFDFLFNGASSTCWTNMIATTTVDAGTDTQDQFALLCQPTIKNGATVCFLEAITYQGTNLGAATWSVGRSNIFYYLTNKYALSLPN